MHYTLKPSIHIPKNNKYIQNKSFMKQCLTILHEVCSGIFRCVPSHLQPLSNVVTIHQIGSPHHGWLRPATESVPLSSAACAEAQTRGLSLWRTMTPQPVPFPCICVHGSLQINNPLAPQLHLIQSFNFCQESIMKLGEQASDITWCWGKATPKATLSVTWHQSATLIRCGL